MSLEWAAQAVRLERLDSFIPVAPEVAEHRNLLRRTDTKFVITPGQVPSLLGALKRHYGILKAGGASLATYETLYFDTPGLRCYHDHRRGRRARHKVRIRHYPDRALSYLEVKTKINASVTLKRRKSKNYRDTSMSPEDWAFVGANTNLATDFLSPSLWIGFRRITLVGLEVKERITVDLDVVFRSSDEEYRLPGIVVVEIKQQPYSARTSSMLALRSAGIRRTSISKYCVGTTISDPDIRSAGLSMMLNRIESLQP